MKSVPGFFATSVGIAVLFIVVTAAVGSWKVRPTVLVNKKNAPEHFMDCAASATCPMA